MKSILEMVHEYQMARQSLLLKDVRARCTPDSVVEAALKIAEYHQVVVAHARATVVNLLIQRKKVSAVKAYKDLVGVGLPAAKNVVDRIEDELQFYAEKVAAERSENDE